MKKKLLAVLLSVAMVVGLVACGDTNKGQQSQNKPTENVAVEGDNVVYRVLYSSEIGTMNYYYPVTPLTRQLQQTQ
jgi:hypothetical protein